MLKTRYLFFVLLALAGFLYSCDTEEDGNGETIIIKDEDGTSGADSGDRYYDDDETVVEDQVTIENGGQGETDQSGQDQSQNQEPGQDEDQSRDDEQANHDGNGMQNGSPDYNSQSRWVVTYAPEEKRMHFYELSGDLSEVKQEKTWDYSNKEGFITNSGYAGEGLYHPVQPDGEGGWYIQTEKSNEMEGTFSWTRIWHMESPGDSGRMIAEFDERVPVWTIRDGKIIGVTEREIFLFHPQDSSRKSIYTFNENFQPRQLRRTPEHVELFGLAGKDLHRLIIDAAEETVTSKPLGKTGQYSSAGKRGWVEIGDPFGNDKKLIVHPYDGDSIAKSFKLQNVNTAWTTPSTFVAISEDSLIKFDLGLNRQAAIALKGGYIYRKLGNQLFAHSLVNGKKTWYRIDENLSSKEKLEMLEGEMVLYAGK